MRYNILNRRAINLIRNFSYTLSSNLISTIISTLVVLIVPKLIGVTEYGYWQLYIFYSAFGGFLNFGWNDGIYLRYGGQEYNKLNRKLFFTQFNMVVILQLLIATSIFIISGVFQNGDKIFIFHMIALSLFSVNVNSTLLATLQTTNRIKEYAKITMLDRIVYCCLIIFFIIFGIRQYKLLIIADVIGKFISLAYAMYCCRDIVYQSISTFYFSFTETFNNISVGIKLMFANIASSLIIGVIRFGIERSWSVGTFGKVSLTLSLSNFLLKFINAVGLVMFPILRRTDEKKIASIYANMRDFLMIVVLGILILYYPMKVILSAWLPEYTDSIRYMAILFPICVYEGKMALLVNTYLKTLRKEKLMLKVNIISLILSLISTFVTTFIQKNLDLAIVAIVIVLAFRCILAELFLSKILEISLYKDIILESMMTFIFIITGWFMNSWLIVVIYALAYVTYLAIKRKDIITTVKSMKLLIKA